MQAFSYIGTQIKMIIHCFDISPKYMHPTCRSITYHHFRTVHPSIKIVQDTPFEVAKRRGRH